MLDKVAISQIYSIYGTFQLSKSRNKIIMAELEVHEQYSWNGDTYENMIRTNSEDKVK